MTSSIPFPRRAAFRHGLVRRGILRRGTALGAATVLAFALAGCGPSGSGDGTSAPAVASPTTDGATGTATSPATGSPTSSSTEKPTARPLSIFYVAVDDAGQSGMEIGCGDSLVSTVTEPVEYTDPVEAAITHLLADKNREHGESGLINALYQSTLKYVSSSVKNGTVTVELTGQPVSGGTCDDPRIQAQLKYTAQAAAAVKDSVILIDGTPIEEFMSQK